jgi:hypothetical protein
MEIGIGMEGVDKMGMSAGFTSGTLKGVGIGPGGDLLMSFLEQPFNRR